MRDRLLLCAFLFLSLMAACRCSSRNSLVPDVPTWPDPSEVDLITVISLSGAVSSQSDLVEIEIPFEYISDMMRVIAPPTFYKHASNVTEIGKMRIQCKNGIDLDIRLIHFGKKPVLFTMQGVPCKRDGRYVDLSDGKGKFLDEALTIEGLIRGIHSKDRVKVKECLLLLDKSAGR